MSDFEIVKESEVEEVKTHKGLTKVWTVVSNIAEIIIISGLLSIFTWLFVASLNKVHGSSMEPTLHNGSFVIVSRLSYQFGTPKRGDVIVFKRNEYKDYIKRVIGLPGETLKIQDCHVYINGNKLDESKYLASSVCTRAGQYFPEGKEYVIPEGKYFVVGDNRTGSTDCRDFGAVDLEEFRGKAIISIPNNFVGGISKIES